VIAAIEGQRTGAPASEPADTLNAPNTSETPARTDGAVDPLRVRLFRGPHGVLRCTVEGEKTVLRAKVVRAFPLSHQARWINVLDGNNKEVCLIEDPEMLDPESRRLALEELEQHYRVPVIRQINSVKNEYRTMFWDVETDRGRREFVMKWASDTILWLSATELVLVDIDTNRFRIADVNQLDRRSRREMSLLE
jgi:hypothetical protein